MQFLVGLKPIRGSTNKMASCSSLPQHNLSERHNLEGVLTQITQATNFRQKQRLVDLYHHAALLLPEVERNHTLPTVAGGSDARHGQQVTA